VAAVLAASGSGGGPTAAACPPLAPWRCSRSGRREEIAPRTGSAPPVPHCSR